jgi:GrpB-like predicted nucleotidyltransferase (UPF0157 family)
VTINFRQEDSEPVHICPYDVNWPAKFAAESNRIAQIFGNRVSEIQHIGSTAIPGLASKDCIDIMVAVHVLEAPELYSEILQPADYVFESVKDVDRYFFRRRAPRSHHLHIVEKDGWHYWRWILMREYLLSHPDWARNYEQLKHQLAIAADGRRETYTESKTDFVRETERIAFNQRPDLLVRFSNMLEL